MSSQISFATFFRQTHWTEKPVADMTTRDWRIFREAHPMARGAAMGSYESNLPAKCTFSHAESR